MMRTERLTAFLMQEQLALQEEQQQLFESALLNYEQDSLYDELMNDGETF